MLKVTQEQLAQLNFEYNRGRLAQSFVASDFFKIYLHPYLKESRVNIALQSANIPKVIHDMEKIALSASLNAGKIDFIESFLSDLQRWISEGEAAFEKLKKVEETE